MLGTVSGYRQISKSLERTLDVLGKRPEIKRDVDYYLANIRNVKSADEFIANDRLFGFAMTAFGLKDMIYAKAFMAKVLREGIDGSKSFALQLADGRFREFAEAFNFARYGATATAFDRVQKGTVDRYLRVMLEQQAGAGDEGVRLALYFARKAPEVTSVYGLLADPALYKVAQTTLGLPAALSGGDLDRQAALIASRLPVADLKDPAKLDKLLVKFTAQWQAQSGSAPAAAPKIGLGTTPLAQFDSSLLFAMQSLKLGGNIR